MESPDRIKKYRLFTLISLVSLVLLAIITFAGSTCWYVPVAKSAVRPFKTGIDEYGGNVLLRFTQPGSDELLLCYLTSREDEHYERGKESGINALSPVFRYSIVHKTFEQVKFSEWLKAAGEVASCEEQRMLRIPAWSVNEARHSLAFNNNPVATAGRTVLQMVIASSGGRLAVLSADGEYKNPSGGVIFFGSPQSASGPRFHEVFRTDYATRIGAPVQLANAGRDVGVFPCWSPDDRVVVYLGISHEKFWLVDTELGAIAKP